MEDRRGHGPAERARQRAARARERHRAVTAPTPPGSAATPPAPPPAPPVLPSPGAGAAPTATTAATATTATTSGAGGARTATRSAAGSRGRSSPATTRRAGAAAGAGRAPELHRLVAPGLLAAAALVAVDLVLGLTGRRVVALQVAAAVVALAAGVALWRGALATRRQVSKLAAQLAETSVDADARQVAVAGLVVNLARRNQSLVDRQLELIGEMEQHEHEPDALADLFQLDHLATRIRRHAESLLVLAGNEAPARTWRHPVLLTEVARAAAAEVEDYQRVDVLVGDDVEVAGHVVADLAHLLAELIENATTYSPAERRVQVRSHTEPSGDATRPAVVVTVEDNGIGMTEADLAAANRALAEPLVLDLRGHTMGLHVVARLADRYGLRVRLDTTPGGGVTALVTLPPDLVADRDPTRPARPTSLQRRPAFSPITGVAPGPTPASFTPGRPSPNPSPKPTSAPATPPTPPPTLPARPATPAAATTPAASTTTATTGLPSPAAVPQPGAAGGPAGPGPDAADPPAAADVPATPAAAAAPTPGSGPAQPHGRGTIDREHVRSMLSRFQAGQRAGRALADTPPGSLAPAPATTATRSATQEDP